MGAEQSNSSTVSTNNAVAINRTPSNNKPINKITQAEDSIDERSSSPGPSICSDTELPYISYTVNRPIGDSPKLQQKSARGGKSSRGSARQVLPRTTATRNLKQSVNKGHNIVVVTPASNSMNDVDTDEDLLRIRSIPMFLPIMRGTLNLPAARDPEILERLEPNGLLLLGTRLQLHQASCSELIATDQNSLSARIKEVDGGVHRLMISFTERQKRYAKLSEKLSKIHEISQQLNRCHSLLNLTLESMETLNNLLPVEERLEPFVWTTG